MDHRERYERERVNRARDIMRRRERRAADTAKRAAVQPPNVRTDWLTNCGGPGAWQQLRMAW